MVRLHRPGWYLGLLLGISAPVVAFEAQQTPVAPPLVELRENYPNPFFPATTIPFYVHPSLCERGQQPLVSLKIYNVLVQVVAIPVLMSEKGKEGRRLDNIRIRCGEYQAFWDGRYQDRKRAVAAGRVLLSVDGRRRSVYTRKMIAQRRKMLRHTEHRRSASRWPCGMHLGRPCSVSAGIAGTRSLPLWPSRYGKPSSADPAKNHDSTRTTDHQGPRGLPRRRRRTRARRGNPVVNDAHLFAALLAQDEGVVQPLLQKAGLNVTALQARRPSARSPGFPRRQGATAEPTLSRELNKVFDRAEKRGQEAGRRLRLDRAPAAGAGRGEGHHGARAAQRRTRSRAEDLRAALEGVRGAPSGHRPVARREVPGPRALHPQPHRPGSEGETRSGHRPGRGSPPGHAGALPPDQEQSGADRRAGRGQDRHRRGAGPADRERRRARVAAQQGDRGARHRPAAGRRQVPGRVRGAAQGGASRS